MRYHPSLHTLAGLAVLGAMDGGIEVQDESGNWVDLRDVKRDTRCTYRELAGPPHPTSRQQRRALQRQSDAAIAKLSKTYQPRKGVYDVRYNPHA